MITCFINGWNTWHHVQEKMISNRILISGLYTRVFLQHWIMERGHSLTTLKRFCTLLTTYLPKVSSSYHRCDEYFSQLSFDSEMHTKSAAVAEFVYTSESNESWEKHSTERWQDNLPLSNLKKDILWCDQPCISWQNDNWHHGWSSSRRRGRLTWRKSCNGIILFYVSDGQKNALFS